MSGTRVRAGLAALAAAPVLLLLAAPRAGEGEPGGIRVAVVATASTDGEVEDCGCKKNPLGGMSRRATVLAEARSRSDAVFLVDAGNWAKDDGFEAAEQTGLVWDLMARLGYDVVTPGDRELLGGLAGARALYARHPEIRVVSANITDTSGNPVWDAYAVVERGGVRAAVTGVTGRSGYAYNLNRKLQQSDDFAFQELAPALRRVIPAMRREADLVIALLHELPLDAVRLVEDVPGMDVAVVGHNPGYTETPDRVENTLVVRGGNRGQYLPVIDLTLDGEGLVTDYGGRGVPLEPGVEREPGIDAIVTGWLAEHRAREQATLKEDAVARAMAGGHELFLGAEVCARCHAAEYTSWAGGVHAAALRKDRGQDPTAAEGVRTDNVQCEHCHGLGTFHGTPALEARVPEATCIACHLAEGAPAVDYAGTLKSGGFHR